MTRVYVTKYALTKSKIYEVEAELKGGLAKITSRLNAPWYVGLYLYAPEYKLTVEEAHAEVTRKFNAKIAEITRRYNKALESCPLL